MKPLPQALLLVDDDPRFRERMAAALRERGTSVWEACDAKSALELVAVTPLDAVVTDLKMPGKNGLDLVRSLAELKPELRIVVLTGYGTIATAVEAMRLGAYDYLVKPCNADQLLMAFGDAAPDEAPEAETVPTLARLEREHIERVLVECQGNVSKAARLLGIHRRTLQYKLAKFPQAR